MVGVSGFLALRLSKLIIDADLDMKGYGILNAVFKAGNKLGADLDGQGKALINTVLGAGTKLGADLDAQGKAVVNAALSGAKLITPLDAAGNKITNLVHDNVDPTSGATMSALQDAIYPSILYDKYLCWSTEEVPPLLYSGYTTGPRRILNIKPDYGLLIRTNAVETAYTIVYYYDVRHSHDLDTQDLTQLQATGSTPTEVLRYDYGAVLSVKELYLIAGVWTGGDIGTINAEISPDGNTWTKIWNASNGTTTEKIFKSKVSNLSFRYLRFTLVNNSTYTTYARVRKIVITI